MLRTAGPTFASLINYLIPAFGFAPGVVWLGEPASGREVIALALVLAAIALVRGRRAISAAKPEIAQPHPRP